MSLYVLILQIEFEDQMKKAASIEEEGRLRRARRGPLGRADATDRHRERRLAKAGRRFAFVGEGTNLRAFPFPSLESRFE